MNQLDPDLKRLLKWAKAASPPKSTEAPFGFSGRVWASRTPAQSPTLFQELQSTAWEFSCAALALIVCGAIVLMSQRASAPPTGEFSSALGFLVSNFTP